MFNLFKNKRKNAHSMLFPMLLWFIPILVLNASIFFVSKIDAHHKEKMQREAANEELRSMSTASEFDFQFSNHAEIFWKKLVNIANFPNTQKLKKQIENALSQTFVQPFPEYDIYVFYAPDKNSSSSLIHNKTNAQNQGIKKVCMTFDYLVESDLQKNESKNNSKKAIAKKFINSSTNPEAYAKVRGIPTYSLYNSESNYFIWNYTINSNNELYGYFLFCKNDVNYEKNSKKLALNKKQREQLTPEDPLYGCLRAYVPFIGNPKSGEYSNPILKKSSNLQNVINSFLPKNLEQIYIYQQKEIPSEIEIGNYKLYTYLGKKQDFLCLLLVPSNSKFIVPSWLHAFNIIYISILILMLFRGLAFNKWPNISLKSRFTMCFALSALFPLSIFGMISYGYIIQSIDSETQNKLMDMQNSLNKFDGFREQIANECIMNFRKLSKNKELIDLIRKEGKADSKAVKDAIIDLFFNKANLPLDAICLVDQNAIGSKITVSKNYSSDNGNNNKITIGEVDNSIISTVLVPTCRALGLIKAEKKGDKYKSELPTSNIETYYNSFEKSRAGKIGHTSLQLAQALGNNKENILNINLDNNIKSIIAFDYVEIEGIPEYVIVVKCNDDALNRIAYAQAASILNIENPNIAFTAFKKNLDGLKEVNNGQHFHLPQFSRISEKVLRRKALEIAEKVASQHKVLTSAYNKNIFFTAYPSKQLTNYVIVGACSTETIDQEVLKKQALLLVIALIAFIIVCICNYIANRITLDPIAKIKAALDKVRDGNNNISIISNGSDEISVLCKEFSNMTKGLRERQALSTLISDQALYAIKQGMLKTDTFNGVALVTDIRNFTGISEANDPNEITGMLNMHFAEMTSIISNYGGRIYKYIGDAIEAVFTDDKNDSDVAGRAALAALSMLDKLKEINANRQKSNLFTYKIGIGLKYGTFYSGEVGSMDTRIDYAILGEPLKKAALLESFSKKNPELPIVIDEFVKEKLENSGFILEHLLTEPETKAYIIKKTPEDLKLQNIISSENHTTNNKLEIIDSNVKIGLFYSKHSYSLFFIIATIFFIFFNDCFNIVVKAKDNYLNNKTQNNINRIFEQIKNSEMTNGLFFEYACRKGISQLKKELVKGFSIKQLKPQIDCFIKNNNIDRYLIFDGENEYTENFDIKKLHIQKSNKKTRVSNLSDLLKEAMLFHSDTQKPYWKTDGTLDDLRARVFEKEVFITNVSDLDLVRKKITPTNEYIYWDFLYDINNKLPNGKTNP